MPRLVAPALRTTRTSPPRATPRANPGLAPVEMEALELYLPGSADHDSAVLYTALMQLLEEGARQPPALQREYAVQIAWITGALLKLVLMACASRPATKPAASAIQQSAARVQHEAADWLKREEKAFSRGDRSESQFGNAQYDPFNDAVKELNALRAKLKEPIFSWVTDIQARALVAYVLCYSILGTHLKTIEKLMEMIDARRECRLLIRLAHDLGREHRNSGSGLARGPGGYAPWAWQETDDAGREAIVDGVFRRNLSLVPGDVPRLVWHFGDGLGVSYMR